MTMQEKIDSFEKANCDLLVACESFMRFAGRDVPSGAKIDQPFLDELKDETHKIRQAIKSVKEANA